jgi:hypothetical protein
MKITIPITKSEMPSLPPYKQRKTYITKWYQSPLCLPIILGLVGAYFLFSGFENHNDKFWLGVTALTFAFLIYINEIKD